MSSSDSLNKHSSDENGDRLFIVTTAVLAAAAFAVFFYIACRLSFGSDVPDEAIRRMIPFRIVRDGALPTGFETDLNSANIYGFSYASYPPFPALLSALFIRLAMFFTENESALIIASRLGNVALGVVSVVYLMKLGRLFFGSTVSAVLLTLVAGFMPQVIFISSYFNADSIALCTVIVMLYYITLGSRRGWSVAVCLKLALAMSVCVLTYYNAYGWCLVSVIFCTASVLRDPGITAKARFILRRGALVAGVCLVLTGWYFVRNYLLYDGDLLALGIRNKTALATQSLGYTVHFCQPYSNDGSLMEMLLSYGWNLLTITSFIGRFGGMTIPLPDTLYRIYILILITGLVCAVPYCCRDRKNRLLYLLLLLGSLITVGLSVWYSYAMDYQPQGRYIITILPTAALFTVIGYREAGKAAASLLRRPERPAVRAAQLTVIAVWLLLLPFVYRVAESGGSFRSETTEGTAEETAAAETER